jgi:ribosome-interacting GTPase 1
METQIPLSDSSEKIKINNYKSYGSSVGDNLKSIQITTKYRYQMLRQDRLKTYCQVAIEESCKRHKIEIVMSINWKPHSLEWGNYKSVFNFGSS